MDSDKIVLTSWNCISPFGIGRPAFREGVNAGLRLAGEFAELTEESPMPAMRVNAVPNFDIKIMLGSKGTRTLDRLTALTIATLSLVLEEHQIGEDEDRDRIGIVLGSSQGSLQSIAGFTRETLIHDRPDYVNPALFPNTVMNCAAGQTAIWHRCRGPNITISAGHLSGLAAIRYSMQALKHGYADLIFAGGAEEMTAANAWAYFHTANQNVREHAPLAEGCALFAIELAASAKAKGQDIHAYILGARVASYDNGPNSSDAQKATALFRCIERLLLDCGVDAEQVGLVCKSQYEPAFATIENAALAHLYEYATGRPKVLTANNVVGNAVSASNAFQLAMLLTHLPPAGTTTHQYALLVAIDGSGTMGCLLLSNKE